MKSAGSTNERRWTSRPHTPPPAVRARPGKGSRLGGSGLDDVGVGAPETVADRIRRALTYNRPDELVAAPDCGMKYLPRDVAYGKLESMVAGAAVVRAHA